MLENMRKQGASMFVWVLFGLLIAGFVISFGPQSVGSSQGCQSSGKATAAEIGGSTIDATAFRFAVNLAPRAEGRMRERLALEALIRREILATEADRRGLHVDDDLVDWTITRGEIHYAGQYVDYRRAFFSEDGEGVFDYKLFKRMLANWGLSVANFKKQQRRELQASTMARILLGSVVASREDAQSRFVDEHTTVTFDVVKFEPPRYADALLITDADLDRYLAAHEAEVKAAYQEAAYKGKSQVRVRRVFVAATPAPAAPAAPAGGGAAPPPPAAPAVDPAKAKLAAARADILAGKKKFVDVAAALDAEPRIRTRGGDWGWYDQATLELPVPGLAEAAKALEVGKVSEVLEAGAGFYLLTVDDKREGDLTFDQVKRELAEKLARAQWGQEAARRAAIAALAKATGKNLRDVFKAPQSGDAEKTGVIEWASEDVPAAWMQGDPVAPAAGAPPMDAKAIMVPSTEVLPALGPLPPTVVDSFGPVPRYGARTPVGESAEIARALFDELAAGQLADRIYEVKAGDVSQPANYVLLQVTAKQLADIAEFEKNVDQHIANLSATMGERYLLDWLRTRCVALATKGEIRPARELLVDVDEDGNRVQSSYQACESMTGGPGL